MTESLRYITVSGEKKLLCSSGPPYHLCTTCCPCEPAIIGEWYPVYPYHDDTHTPKFNLEEEGFWGDGVAVGYTKWRFYMRPGGYYPPYNPGQWVNSGFSDSCIRADFQDNIHQYYFPFNNPEGDITPTGRLTYLQRYLSSFTVQYNPSGPVELVAVIILCVSPNGIDWPDFPT